MNQQLLFGAQAPGFRLTISTTATPSAALPSAGDTIRIVSHGPDASHYAIGPASQTASLPTSSATTIASLCILAGEDATFAIPRGSILQISAISSGSAVADIYTGVGM